MPEEPIKKILSVFGTRPEAIKMAPVIKELEKRPETFCSLVCVTAQHRQMLDQVLHLFDIRPSHDLNIMRKDQSLFDVTQGVLRELEQVLKRERPDLVLVQGDTTTTMAASLAAFYCGIPVGHVEAGLRTGNKFAPFPEEVNRRLTSVTAELHFAPTPWARDNLLREGFPSGSIFVTGNTVVDALLMVLNKIKNENLEPEIIAGLLSHDPSLSGFLDDEVMRADRRRIILVTGHRRESFGIGFENICRALAEIALAFPEIGIIYPVHLNPNVQEPVNRILRKGELPNVFLLEPLDYLPFVYLMKRSYLILTDSGGIQEEAPSLGKPVLVMRDTTERPEAVEAGTARLVGTEKSTILKNVFNLVSDSAACTAMASAANPFGDGLAASRITEICLQELSQR